MSTKKINNKGKELSDQLKLNWMPERDCELNEEILADLLFNWHTLNSSQKTRLFNYFLINHGAESGPNFKEIPRLYEQNLALDRNKAVISFHNLVAGFSAHSTPKLYSLSTNNGSAKANALKLKDKISKLNKNNGESQTFSYLCEEQRVELLKENSGLQLNKKEHFVYKQHEDSSDSNPVIANEQRQSFKPLIGANNSRQSSTDNSRKKDLFTSDVDSSFRKIQTENHMNHNATKSAHNVITQGPANFLKDRNLITPEKAMFEKQQRCIHMMSQTVIKPPIDSIPGTFIRELSTAAQSYSASNANVNRLGSSKDSYSKKEVTVLDDVGLRKLMDQVSQQNKEYKRSALREQKEKEREWALVEKMRNKGTGRAIKKKKTIIHRLPTSPKLAGFTPRVANHVRVIRGIFRKKEVKQPSQLNQQVKEKEKSLSNNNYKLNGNPRGMLRLKVNDGMNFSRMSQADSIPDNQDIVETDELEQKDKEKEVLEIINNSCIISDVDYQFIIDCLNGKGEVGGHEVISGSSVTTSSPIRIIIQERADEEGAFERITHTIFVAFLKDDSTMGWNITHRSFLNKD